MGTMILKKDGETENMSAHSEPAPISREIIERLVLEGDLSKMSQKQKVDYYVGFCQRLGMDPATKPFMILKLNGKESLYCDRSGAAQLNKIYNISHTCIAREKIGDAYVVTMRASDKTHQTESTGVVAISGLKGDTLSNAMMKAETKAKRRSTLDLVGLGILDECELSSIKGATIRAIDEDDQEPTDKHVAEGSRIAKTVVSEDVLDSHIDSIILSISKCQTLESLKQEFTAAYKALKEHPRIGEIEAEKERIKAFIIDAQKKITKEMNDVE